MSDCQHKRLEWHPSGNFATCHSCGAVLRDDDIPETPVPARTPTVTRIDLWDTSQGLIVHKYADGWYSYKPGTDLGQQLGKPGWTIDQACAWLKARGYTVRRWQGGARGWLGKPLPVRNALAAKAMRRRLEGTDRRHNLQLHALDLILDM